jgi:hypothetical protein
MPEAKNYVFTHSELAEVLVKKLDLHEGHWGIYLEFSLVGGNVPSPADASNFIPAAVTLVNKIGLQRFDTPNNLSVDASAVNPGKAAPAKKR